MYGLAQNFVLASLPAKDMATEIGGFGDFDNGLGGLLSIDGDYLAFPMNIETLVTFVNKANADTLGVDLSSTVELTEVDPNTVLIPLWNTWFGVAMTNSADIEMLGMNADGTFFSDLTQDFADLTADQQALFEALFAYYQAHQELESPVFTDDVWGYMDNNFKTGGENVLRIEGPWSTGGLANHAGDDMGIMPIGQVTINGLPLKHWRGGWGLAVNSRIEEDAAKMELAQKFIVEIMNPDNAADWFEAAGKIIPNAQDGAYTSLTQQSQDVIASVYTSYEEAPERPLFLEWGNVWGTWENSMKSWPSVKPTTAEEAYNEVKAAFDAMMSQLQ
jgi:arabinogalactan oligomer/maltooligosaccharide transport system substrate-binding protein